MSALNPLELLKQACARLDADDGASRARAGTAYLIRPGWAVTCAHVVRRWAEPMEFKEIKLRFPSGTRIACVQGVDKLADCALLKLDAPLDNVPLLEPSPGATVGAQWVTYGFPKVVPTGLLLHGEVQDPIGLDQDGEPSIVLYSRNIAAANSMAGFSGSPIVVSGRVIGHMKSFIPNPDKFLAEPLFGIVFACSIRSVEALLPAQERIALSPAPYPLLDSPTPASLRRLIKAVLIGDDDLDAFCSDHFYLVKNRFTAGMTREAKMTLLLEHVDRKEILAALRETDPDSVIKNEAMLQYR